MEFAVYMDAVFDTYDDVPEEIRTTSATPATRSGR